LVTRPPRSTRWKAGSQWRRQGARARLVIRTWLETERDQDRAEALALEAEREAASLDAVSDLGHAREVLGYICCLKGSITRGMEILIDAAAVFKDIQVNCGSHVVETAAASAAIANRFELSAELLGSAKRIREGPATSPDRGNAAC
jgi:hypothetical protein